MRFLSKFRSACFTLCLLALASCHQVRTSSSKFIPTDNPTVGILEDRDLHDEFGLSIMVIDQEGLGAWSISMGTFEHLKTRFELIDHEGQKALRVFSPSDPSTTLLSFAVTTRDDGRTAVDFASGNNFELTRTVDKLGGEVTSIDQSSWVTEGQPETIRVQQDADTYLADIKHKISYTNGTWTNTDGVTENMTSTGSVVVRVALHRLASLQKTRLPTRTKSEAYERNFGFQLPSYPGNDTGPIQRLLFDPAQRERPQIRYYLKDFPAAYDQLAREAILQWNQAFGWDAITVESASADMNIGDPRHNVIRWIEDGDETLGYAGMEIQGLVSKETGASTANSIVINGGFNIQNYRQLIDYAQRLNEIDPKLVVGRIGNVPMHVNAGETPLLPFVTDVTVSNPEEYIRGYYFATIMHEVGHSLGLEHNFKASTELGSVQGTMLPSSIMDYAPRWARNRAQSIGSYDKAAIRWGYLGEESARLFAFCDDVKVHSDIFCNMDDWGDPVENTADVIQKGIEILSTVPLLISGNPNQTIMYNNFYTLFKLQTFPEQIPEAKRASVKDSIDRVLSSLQSAQPSETLNAEEKAIITKHISILRETADSAKQMLEYNVSLQVKKP